MTALTRVFPATSWGSRNRSRSGVGTARGRNGTWRVRAGLIGWSPPATFYVQPAPNQKWDIPKFTPVAQAAVDALVSAGFEPKWMRAHLTPDDELLLAPDFEEQVVEWAHDRFRDIEGSGLFALPLQALGHAALPDQEAGEA